VTAHHEHDEHGPFGSCGICWRDLYTKMTDGIYDPMKSMDQILAEIAARCNECGSEVEEGSEWAAEGVCSHGCATAQAMRLSGHPEDA
jgi:hypothetical protein